MTQLTCGFVGLGLIGGSIAKALKRFDLTMKIVAYDTNPGTLEAALSEGIIDLATTAIDASFETCDYIFLCAPVSRNNSNLESLKPYISPSCTLTDVGSTKAEIHRHITGAGLDSCFIGGHPMAGSERTGYQNSKALLLENAYYILTPSPGVPSEKVAAYRHLVLSMGAIPLELSWEQHDYVTAAISHLPHLVAASLVNLVKNSDSEDGVMKMVAAGGFKDITRIASSSGDMWQQICLTNKENISSLLKDYILLLEQAIDYMERDADDELGSFFNTASAYRNSFANTSSGPIKHSFALTVEIADRTGAIASIATMLANHNISIKNIGIVHNREYEEGTLRIEFYDKTSVSSAKELLNSEKYPIHDKTEL